MTPSPLAKIRNLSGISCAKVKVSCAGITGKTMCSVLPWGLETCFWIHQLQAVSVQRRVYFMWNFLFIRFNSWQPLMSASGIIYTDKDSVPHLKSCLCRGEVLLGFFFPPALKSCVIENKEVVHHLESICFCVCETHCISQ